MCGPASNLQTGYRFLTRSHRPKNVATLGKLSPNLAPVRQRGVALVWVTPARRRCQGWLGAGCSGRVHTEAPLRAGLALVRTCPAPCGDFGRETRRPEGSPFSDPAGAGSGNRPGRAARAGPRLAAAGGSDGPGDGPRARISTTQKQKETNRSLVSKKT